MTAIPLRISGVVLALSCGAAMLHAQAPELASASNTKSAAHPSPEPAAGSAGAADTPVSAAAVVARYPAAPLHPADCGDSLSEALDANPITSPCWSNIRTVDRWNTTEMPDTDGLGATGFHLPAGQATHVSLLLGSLAGADVSSDPMPHAYGGIAGASGLIDKRSWQLMFEDAAGGASFLTGKDADTLGTNRVAVRAAGELSPRLMLQGSVTNSYGSDAIRTLAPLDYRRVGEGEAVVADTVAYGLHTGRVTDEEEDGKLRYELSRRSNWDFVAGHTLQRFSDDGVQTQTERGRAEYLHALSPNMAVGVYGSAEHQDGLAPCSLGGAGLRSLTTFAPWGSKAALNISGTVNGADSACGKKILFTGDASFSVQLKSRSALFVSANRDLSDGVIEHTALLDSTSVGFNHRLAKRVEIGLSGAAILANNPADAHRYSGTFETASLSAALGSHFTEELSVRHFQVSPASLQDNHVYLTGTLWYNPRPRRSDR